jgi:hypothetical protein
VGQRRRLKAIKKIVAQKLNVILFFADSYVLETSEVSDFAAEMACKRKHSKYS